ncbi:hypothetical protein [Streptomyces sp. JJ38]|uniref:hypothetical protein n=1 Tax=Streptomyces sp. JJ38 TaxID=2738128 RepID=UPI00214CABB9|nr:hypothetical protein [Streptomyces sp. JJ38]MBW1595584.1 hypothetical protein [Streptomyces sp. JJ38]
MTETTTVPAVSGAEAAPEVAVRIEDDATPLVRLIGRALRDSARAGHALPVLRKPAATVAIRSHDTPQAATITFGGGAVEVSGGVPAEPDAAITVDLNARFSSAEAPSGDAELAADVLLALSPPVPDWQAAAEQFWTATRSVPGIPDVLVAITEGPDGLEQVVLGEGATQYLIAGSPETLAGVFSGADDLLAALSAGVLGVQGTLSQLSVMVGASWKVRYDV